MWKSRRDDSFVKHFALRGARGTSPCCRRILALAEHVMAQQAHLAAPGVPHATLIHVEREWRIESSAASERPPGSAPIDRFPSGILLRSCRGAYVLVPPKKYFCSVVNKKNPVEGVRSLLLIQPPSSEDLGRVGATNLPGTC